MPTSNALSYCAGFFDGEGCILINKYDQSRSVPPSPYVRGHRIRYTLFINLSQARPEPVRFMHNTLGGRLDFRPRTGKTAHYSGMWIWIAHGVGARKILLALRPYLILKSDQADIAIRFQESRLTGTGRSYKLGLTASEMQEREVAFRELQRLKRLHQNPDLQAEYLANRAAINLPIRV